MARSLFSSPLVLAALLSIVGPTRNPNTSKVSAANRNRATGVAANRNCVLSLVEPGREFTMKVKFQEGRLPYVGHSKTQRRRRRRKVFKDSLPFVCVACGKAYKYHGSFERHVRDHETPQGKNMASIECNHCFTAFDTVRSLRLHIIKIHKPKIEAIRCDICGKDFVDSEGLKDHKMDLHSSFRPFACTVCGKRFKYSHHLQSHNRTHTGEKPYSCPICPLNFSQVGQLANHRATHNGTQPNNICTCGRFFSSKQSLKVHQMAVHKNLRPFNCRHCSQTFTQKMVLLRHMYHRHIREKPLKCHKCGKGFVQKNHYLLHNQTCGEAVLSKLD